MPESWDGGRGRVGAEHMSRPSLFLGHVFDDRPMVRRIADDLVAAGTRVVLDEATLFIDDRLLERLSATIGERGFLAVALSPRSVRTKWVTEELRALADGRAGEGVVILPLLLQNCDIPDFLDDRIYADFRRPETYQENLDLVMRRLGLADNPSPMLKAKGMPWPLRDEHLKAATLIDLQLVFFDGSRCITGDSHKEPHTLVMHDDTRPASLPALALAGRLQLDLGDRTTMFVHYETQSTLRSWRRLCDEGVASGDCLIIAVGAGAAVDLDTVIQRARAALSELGMVQEQGGEESAGG
jgi:hypothetical protein